MGALLHVRDVGAADFSWLGLLLYPVTFFHLCLRAARGHTEHIEDDVDAQGYLAIVLRRKVTVLTTLLLVVVLVGLGTVLLPKRYTSSTTLRIATAVVGSVDYTGYATEYADRLMNTYAKIAESEAVAAQLQKQFALAQTPQIKATITADTELLDLRVEATDPVIARDMAAVLAEMVIQSGKQRSEQNASTVRNQIDVRVAEAERQLKAAQDSYQQLLSTTSDRKLLAPAELQTELAQRLYIDLLEQSSRLRLADSFRSSSVVVLVPAGLPDRPSFPNPLLNVILALLGGSIAGVVLAFVFNSFDTRIFTPERLSEVSELPVIGMVPVAPRKAFRPNHAPFYEEPHLVAALQNLRTNLLSESERAPYRTLLVASSEPGEGKSLIAACLAYSYAQLGKRVLLVDADMRVPSTHVLFGIQNNGGLSSALHQLSQLTRQQELNGELNSVLATVDRLIQRGPVSGLYVLSGGSSEGNATELLAGDRTEEFVKHLRFAFDMVIFDAPPILAVPDSVTLAGVVERVLLVASNATTTESAIRMACERLRYINAQVLGVVFNRSARQKTYASYEAAHKAAPPTAKIRGPAEKKVLVENSLMHEIGTSR